MNGREEQHCQFVSSRGILKSCDVRPRSPVSSIRAFPRAEYPPNWIEELQPGNSVYVCTSALTDFVANVLSRLPASCPPFVLVTGDADESAPLDVLLADAAAELLNSPHILAWFAQNCVGRHPKLVPLPIGLDYHTIESGSKPWCGPKRSPLEQEAELLALRQVPAGLSPHRAYANFQFNLNSRFGNNRRAAMAQIPPECVYYEPKETTRLQSWHRQRLHHRFVLSPPGNGLDCHRTWEALCLGCIPIVRATPIDSLWEGLPVWIVTSWSEVTEEAMAQKAAEFDNSVDANAGNSKRVHEKLLLTTWADKIRRAGAAAV